MKTPEGASSRLSIAVLGAGAAGITAAHLLSRRHDVCLFEKNDRLGGHVHTVQVEQDDRSPLAVDTGFIVCNNRTYPQFHRLLADLGCAVQNSEMSFGVRCDQTGLEYGSRNLNSLFAQRSNLASPRFLRMLWEIPRFNRRASNDLAQQRINGQTLGRYLEQAGCGGDFIDGYLIPMGAAIWSTSPREMLEYPAGSFLRFFERHGLLTVNDHPQWQTVVGGSGAYVQAFQKRFRGEIVVSADVAGVRRTPQGAIVYQRNSRSRTFDFVVIACHADEALALLIDPTPHEQRLLGAWRYQDNQVDLHSDASVLPVNRRAWASWNYRRRQGGAEKAVEVTYHMNRLQRLTAAREYCVTLNAQSPIDDALVHRRLQYAHPKYSHAALQSQSELPTLNGVQRTYFCGSYFGSGFHEDAVVSGLAVAKAFGETL